MNRKAQLSGASDLPWAAMLLIILILFAFYMGVTSQAEASKALGPIEWETQWLANSLAQHPVNEKTVLEALQSPDSDEELERLTRQALNNTITQEPLLMTVFMVRNQTRVSCYRRQTLDKPGNSVRTVTQCSTGPVSQVLPRSAADVPSAIKELKEQYPVGVVAGPQNTYIGVVGQRTS